MDELTAIEYERVRPFFQYIAYHRPAVFMVLDGILPARVFVDSREQPSVGLIVSDNCYLAGSMVNATFNTAFRSMLRTEVIPQKEHLFIFTFNEGWLDVLEELFGDNGIKRLIRTSFDFDPLRFRERHSGWRERMPAGYLVQRIDAQIAARVSGPVEIWGSIERFLAHGFGFCVIRDDRIVSNCQTVAVGDRRAEIGIGTGEAYRRQGLATLAGCAYLEHCLANDLQPEWQCYYNVASELLAEKLGFANKREMQVAYIHTPRGVQ